MPYPGDNLLTRACLAALLSVSAAAAAQDDSCGQVHDLLLDNGVIHTMDADNRVVNALRVVGDRIVGTGTDMPPTTSCTRRIDLKGRTVVPGLIDNHNHIVALGLRPGHDIRLGSVTSVAAVLDAIEARTSGVPAGEWITAIGGFDAGQFSVPGEEARLPTLTELDSVSPRHPVYLQVSFAGPGVTNSAGKAWLEEQSIVVGNDGAIAGGPIPNAATRTLFALRQLEDLEDHKRGTLEALEHAASLGITTHLDQGGFPATGTEADGAAHLDPERGYDAVLALHREGRLINRIRLNFLHMDTDPDTPQLAARLANAFPAFGDDRLRVLGIGEFTAGDSPILFQASETWLNGTRRVAEAGWRNENHSLTGNDYQVIIDGWQQVHEALGGDGIRPLGWVLAHAPFISEDYARRLMALGGGVSVLGGWRYISGSAEANGPPFRMLDELGIPMGMSSDGMQISPMNPWLGLYYVVTGRNVHGEDINAGQTLSRHDALRLYTAANRWFLQEDDLGSLDPGMLADLVVLDRDYFDEEAVTDEDIKAVRSLLTLVDGRVVHGDPEAL